MLHEADPTTGEADPPDMPRLEQQVKNLPPGRGVFLTWLGYIILFILEIYPPLPPPDHPSDHNFLQVAAMGPLIDAELERTDRRHAQLTRLSHELVMFHSSQNASFIS